MNTRSKATDRFLRQRGWIAGACFLSIFLVAANLPADEPSSREKQATARAILTRMAEFLSKTPHMSVTIHAAYDTVQQNGYKVE